MKPRTGGPGETLERLLPFLTIVAVVTAGWFWSIRPRLDSYLRARTDVAAIEERVRTLQQASSRVPPQPRVDLDLTQREFEARMSAEDEVADGAAALARAVLARAPPRTLRSSDYLSECPGNLWPSDCGKLTVPSGNSCPCCQR